MNTAGVEICFISHPKHVISYLKLVHALQVLRAGSIRNETNQDELPGNREQQNPHEREGPQLSEACNRNKHKHKKQGDDQRIRAEAVD